MPHKYGILNMNNIGRGAVQPRQYRTLQKIKIVFVIFNELFSIIIPAGHRGVLL
jgi:hypothetical protein